MKKNYIIPATEKMELACDGVMQQLAVSPGTAADGVHADAPARGTKPF